MMQLNHKKEEVHGPINTNPFASGLRCSYTAERYIKEEMYNQRNRIETKLRVTHSSLVDKETKETKETQQFEDDKNSVDSVNIQKNFAKVKNKASVVEKHIRDEKIKFDMFTELMAEEFNRTRDKSKSSMQKQPASKEPSEDARAASEINLQKYKTKLKESELLYKKEMEEKIALSLFAADKYFKQQKLEDEILLPVKK